MAVGQPFCKVGVVSERQLDVHAGVPFTRTHLLNLSADSKVGSGAGDRHGQRADGNLAVHPVTSESLPARTLIVMWASVLT